MSTVSQRKVLAIDIGFDTADECMGTAKLADWVYAILHYAYVYVDMHVRTVCAGIALVVVVIIRHHSRDL